MNLFECKRAARVIIDLAYTSRGEGGDWLMFHS